MKPKKGVVPPQLRKYLFKRRGVSMAKRKYGARVRSVARRVYAGARRVGKRVRRYAGASVGASMTLMTIGFSFGYGFARGWLVQNEFVQKALAMIPFGGAYKDNILLGGAAFLVNYLMKPTNAWLKLGLRTVVHNEAFIMGAKAQAGLSLTDSSSNGLTVGQYI